eukprot:gene4194-5298_t
MPLNAFVVALLLKIKNLSPQRVFLACAGAHAAAFFSYLYFYSSSGFNGDRLDSKRLQDQYLDEGEGNIVASSLLLRDDIDA